MTRFLLVEDLLFLAEDTALGPVRDLGLLEVAVVRPRTRLGGAETYPTLELKAAALLDSLVRDHPLVDRNKALGWMTTIVFLDINGVRIEVASGGAELKRVAESLACWERRTRTAEVDRSPLLS